MDAFDADALIYASAPGHPLGQPVRILLDQTTGDDHPAAGVGSVLLLPELLSKPTRNDAGDEVGSLEAVLARLDLWPVDRGIADLAVVLGAKYRLRAADGIHLATAVAAGAERFITNNKGDFAKSIDEVDVTYPEDLPIA